MSDDRYTISDLVDDLRYGRVSINDHEDDNDTERKRKRRKKRKGKER